MTTDEERVDRGGWVAMTLRRYSGLENYRSLYVVEMIFHQSLGPLVVSVLLLIAIVCLMRGSMTKGRAPVAAAAAAALRLR